MVVVQMGDEDAIHGPQQGSERLFTQRQVNQRIAFLVRCVGDGTEKIGRAEHGIYEDLGLAQGNDDRCVA